MKTRNAIVAALAASSVLLMSACDVDQTQEGEMPDVDVEYREGELPEYEIRQTEEGRMPDVDVDVEGGRLPRYDVETPDVDVGMEERTITVPDVDVEMPDDDEPDMGMRGEDMPAEVDPPNPD